MGLKVDNDSGDYFASNHDKERGPVTRLLYENRKIFLLAFGLTAVTELLSLAPIVYMMNMFDRVMISRSVVTLASLTLILIIFYVFASSVDWLRRRLLLRFALRLDWDLAADVFDASFRKFAGRGRVNVQQVMNDLTAVRKFFHQQGFIVLIETPYALFFALICFLVHPWLGIYAVVAVFLMATFAVLKARAITPMVRRATQTAAETNRSVAEILRHSETALALGMQPTVRGRWYTRHQSDIIVDANGHEAAGLIGALSGLVNKSAPRLALALAVYLSINGEISPGMTIAAMFLVRRTMGSLQGFINHWPNFVKARLSIERLETLLSEDSSWKDRMPLPQPVGSVEVEDLIVAAPGAKRPILDRIRFKVEPGEVLAVVGPSGAGKSTLARHLVGILEPTSGSVRLDGAEIHDWIRSPEVPHIGYVPQDVLVLEGTVAENISRLMEVVPAEVVRAAELIGLHKSILAFPDGYNTYLGDGNFSLTGGQKQRLLIARALYGDPKYVVMDEPSSSLDAESEDALLILMRILRNNGTTVIYTTHRANLILASDKILVLERGVQRQFGATCDIGVAVVAAMSGKAASDEVRSSKTRRIGGNPSAKRPQLIGRSRRDLDDDEWPA